MIEPGKFAVFVGAAWALIITPGPDMLYVLSRGMAQGRRAGVVSAGGVIGGILVHTTAAALGLTLIFQTSALAFLVVRYLGAAYLLYLGLQAWRDPGAFKFQTPTPTASVRSLFWQGVLSNVLNPKVAVFFLAFLPQFVDRSGSPTTLQLLILGLTFALFGLCFLVMVGYFAGVVGAWLTRRPRFTNTLRWLTGGILVSLGLRLAFAEQR